MNAIHPAPLQFSADQLAIDPILHFFHYTHLPAALQTSARPFCELAGLIINSLPRNAERTVALCKLLEAKDAVVRANVGAPGVASGGPGNFFDRLKAERDELKARLEKLGAYLGGQTLLSVPENQREMLVDQRAAMTQYLAILEARIENIQHAADKAASVRRPSMEGLEDGSAVRETGGHDQDRDGPVNFGG